MSSEKHNWRIVPKCKLVYPNIPTRFYIVQQKFSFLWWSWWSTCTYDGGCFDEGIVMVPYEFYNYAEALNFVKCKNF